MLLVSGCSHVQWQPAGAAIGAPALNGDHVLTADGYRLPLHRWLPPGEIKAVVLGLHGFNDYGNSFHYLQEAVVEAGNVAIYAYDQRGFGATKRPGIWAGQDTLVDDADYKGDDTNLLVSTGSLVVNFEGNHTLSITGFSAKTADLGGGITNSSNDWSGFSVRFEHTP